MSEIGTVSCLEDRILGADSLPSLPAVAVKVLELTQNPNVSVVELAGVVQNDPALSAKLLKTANSAMFGVSKRVSTVKQAVTLLGLRAVKVLVLSFSLVEAFRQKRKGEFDFELYWRRSLTTAVGAKALGELAAKARRDEVFVGGLLADLGMLAAFRCAPGEYGPVLQAQAAGEGTLQDLEQQRLGVTHAAITARLLAHWQLPEMLCQAVAAHHGAGYEELDERTRMLAGLLWSAAMIAELFCGDTDSAKLEEVMQRCRELTGVTEENLETVLTALQSKVTEAANLMSLSIGETMDYETLRTQAVSQLAAITMDAEIGFAEATRQAERTRQQLAEVSEHAQVLSKQAQALSTLANMDGLTNLANRHAFDVHLAESLEQAASGGSGVGIIMIDLDRFKKLNDTHGHPAGDEALRLVGRCLGKLHQGVVFCARYGGEEFAVVVSGVPADKVQRLAERIRVIIERIAFEHAGQQIGLSASLGVAQVGLDREQVEAAELIRRADQALYRAKEAGRNRVEVFS